MCAGWRVGSDEGGGFAQLGLLVQRGGRALNALAQAGDLVFRREHLVAEEGFGVKFPDDRRALKQLEPPIEVVVLGRGKMPARILQVLQTLLRGGDGMIFFGHDLFEQDGIRGDQPLL